MSVSLDHHFHRDQMTFNRLLAWSDDRFEPKWLPSRVLPRVRLAHRKLSDGPSQKIEAHLSLIFPERMGNFRLAGFEFQSYRTQPCFQKLPCFLHSCIRWVKNDQIIGYADDVRHLTH